MHSKVIISSHDDYFVFWSIVVILYYVDNSSVNKINRCVILNEISWRWAVNARKKRIKVYLHLNFLLRCSFKKYTQFCTNYTGYRKTYHSKCNSHSCIGVFFCSWIIFIQRTNVCLQQITFVFWQSEDACYATFSLETKKAAFDLNEIKCSYAHIKSWT